MLARLSWLPLVVMLSSAGCAFIEGRAVCAEDNDCPPSLPVCRLEGDAGSCVEGEVGTKDAGVEDAGVDDAGVDDAGSLCGPGFYFDMDTSECVAATVPRVDCVVPPFALAFGGQAVRVQGEGFLPGTTVEIGGKRATVTQRSSGELSVTVPESTGPGYAVVVKVTNPGDVSAEFVYFTYLPRRAMFDTAPLVFGDPDTTVVGSGDVDNDGQVDLIARVGGRPVVLYQDDSDGFGCVTPLSSMSSAVSNAAVGDVDGDDEVDVVTLANGQLSLFRGLGARRFAPPAIESGFADTVRLHAWDAAPGEEIFAATSAGFSVLKYANAAVQVAESYDMSSVDNATGTTSVELVDLSGDGLLDVVAAGSNGFRFRPGLADGSFGDKVELGTSWVTGVYAADLNGDQRTDLVLPRTSVGIVTVTRGTDDQLSISDLPNHHGVGYAATAVAIGDLNGDSRDDVVFDAVFAYSNFVLYGSADGTMTMGPRFWFPSVPHALDLDGDGHDELLGNDGSGLRRLSVAAGGSLHGSTYFKHGDFSPYNPRLVLADVDGDTRLDIVAASAFGGTLGITFGASGPLEPFSVGTRVDGAEYTAAAVSDFNGDGRGDVVLSQGLTGATRVYLSTSTGDLGPATSYGAGTNVAAIATADLDGDDATDVVAAATGSQDLTPLWGDGSGDFTIGSPIPLSAPPVTFAVAQVDGDEHPDIVAATSTDGALQVIRGVGARSFADPQVVTLPTAPTALALGDLDGDGCADAVVGTNTGLSWLYGDCTGALALGSTASAPGSCLHIELADMDVDGNVDVMASCGGRVVLLQHMGARAFAGPYLIAGLLSSAASFGAQSFALGDLDGDGDPDLAVGNGHSVAVFESLSIP